MNYCSRIVLIEKDAEIIGPEVLELVNLIDTEKSIEDAASTLKISKAKASKYIKAIEKHIGEPAIVKSRRSADSYNVHISPACRDFVGKYSEFLKKNEEAIKRNFELIF